MALPQEKLLDTCFTVKEISQQIKGRLESGFQFIRIRGEVSGVTYHKSGHVYFALKDDGAVIDCVAWKGLARSFSIPLTDGLEIIGRGSVTTYMGRSKYQFVMDSFEAAGRGALYTLLEQRRKLLQAEGLFDVSKKQQLPRLPKRIGLITSSEGAVLHDIQARLEERYIEDSVFLWPVTVQGENTPKDVIAAIKGFHQFTPRPDVLIVARGGGSFEDLWYFNDEELARVIQASEIPIITAIGHEPDTPLIDYASDKRASTPTNAAEIVAPRKEDIVAYLERLQQRMQNVVMATIQTHQTTLQKSHTTLHTHDTFFMQRIRHLEQIHLEHLLERFHATKSDYLRRVVENIPSPVARIQNLTFKTTQLHNTLQQKTDTYLTGQKANITQIHHQLNGSNFMNILKKGFALATTESGDLITSTLQLAPNTPFKLQLHDGTANATTTSSSTQGN